MKLAEISSREKYARIRYTYKARNFKVPYLKPLAFGEPSYFHRRYSNNETFSIVPVEAERVKYKKRGIILEWPHRGKLYSEKELCTVARMIAHFLFWLHVVHILPNGTALDFKQPPWNYVAPLAKPENRNYIIEPDWNTF